MSQTSLGAKNSSQAEVGLGYVWIGNVALGYDRLSYFIIKIKKIKAQEKLLGPRSRNIRKSVFAFTRFVSNPEKAPLPFPQRRT